MSATTSTELFTSSINSEAQFNTTAGVQDYPNPNIPFLYNARFLSETAQRVYDWFTYVIPFMALTLNGLSIAVFLQRRSRQKATVSSFLVALAVCDVMAVTMMFYTAYSRLGWWTVTTTACKAVVYINAVGRMSSIWLTVFFTVERFIAVKYVFKRMDMITPFRVRMAIMSLLCTMMVEQSFILVWVEAIPPGKPAICFTMDESIYKMYMMTLVVVNRLFNFILPFLLVGVMNAFIVVTVQRSKRITGKTVSGHDHRERRLTWTLVLVSSVSFLLLLPETTSKILESLLDPRPPWLTGFTLLADVISYLNHCMNFFFYVISGKEFRKGLTDMVCCHRQSKTERAATPQMSGTGSTHTSQLSMVSSVHNLSTLDAVTEQK